ncbi:MAG: hypothetical protein KBG25_07245 [Paludibacteraceae bacterium]|nr:hypothetical protein [Paludibacteraceae bacterium]
MQGIITTIRCDRQHFQFPLCDLDILGKNKRNIQLIEDYKVWFGNKPF